MSEALIEYRCGEPTHVSMTDREGPRSPITVVEGKWAYCPNGKASGHKWELISPTALSGLSSTRVIRRSAEVVGG
jgi:hypothetical protein